MMAIFNDNCLRIGTEKEIKNVIQKQKKQHIFIEYLSGPHGQI
jgi:hypothetical protein